jgi:type IV secretory pathway TraG/TraD family ATPase VirD4
MNAESTKACAALCLLGALTACMFKLTVPAVIFFAGVGLLAWSYWAGVRDAHRTTPIVMRLLGIPFTWEDICAHIVIIGRSGCGKTVGVMKSILIQLVKNVPNWGGIILDEKGDFHELLDAIWRAQGKVDRLVILRVPLPEEAAKIDKPLMRINLIGDRSIPWSTYAQLVIDVAVSQGQKTDNAFFKTQGRTILTQIFEAIELAGHPVTLATAYAFVASDDVFKLVLSSLDFLPPSPRLSAVQSYWANLDATAPGQRDGIFGTAKNYLAPYSEPLIAEVFCSQEPNFRLQEIDDCKLVVPSIPQLYLFSRSYVQAFMKLWFFFDTFRRYDLPHSRTAIPRLPRRGLIIDEAQNSLLGSEEGLADHKAIDKVRGAGAFLIYAMQSYSSAKPNIQDDSKVNTIFANIGTHIIHRINDAPGRKIASEMFVLFDKKKITRNYSKTGDISFSETTNETPTRRPDFFLTLKKFEAVITHVEGRTAHGIIAPLSDDGTRVESWYRSSSFNRNFNP